MSLQCHDRCSGERFEVPDGDDLVVAAAIEDYIALGIDRDTGAVDYRVEVSDGRHFSGTVEPIHTEDWPHTPAGPPGARRNDMGEKRYCLVISYPQEFNCGTWGHVGPNRRLVRPGTSFDGEEGVVGEHKSPWYRSTYQRTGWYNPVEWLTVNEAADRLENTIWESALTYEDGTPHHPDGIEAGAYRLAGHVAQTYACSGPEDFPGLAEHYPHLALPTEVAS